MISRTTYSRLATLVLLLIFLTFSAWLVSIFGNIWISLGRDILLVIFLFVSLLEWRNARKPQLVDWLIIVFIFSTFLSFFVRTDSLSQWLRGVRYLIEPFVLLLAIRIFPLSDSNKWLLKTLLWVTGVVILGAIIEYFYPSYLSLTLHQVTSGYLGQIHLAGSAIRLQSILAGPNALGLFMLVVILLGATWKNLLPIKLSLPLAIILFASLFLTYSRSSYIGVFAGLLLLLIIAAKQIKNSRFLLTVLVTVSLFGAVAVIIAKPADFIRTQSNTARLAQYERVYHDLNQIGWLGRGAGTTGLVSEYAFDNSPNYHSENTYLDVYENIGPIGALAYLGIWIALIYQLIRQKERHFKVIGSMLFGLAIAGLFIDSYTGQIALWSAVIFAGLT